ncbi:hypothetical protein [Effusibacillus lacus]|uniref:hypothetical protein n=1 Tax=Effusibacillus lacus TaxID=1348429 RepID=UPI00104F0E07|nr:hypothetical protein [Effusibacillus lacus]TCS76797.1 hypothetical protein EDD64_10117 [Effusibacillus lacus]
MAAITKKNHLRGGQRGDYFLAVAFLAAAFFAVDLELAVATFLVAVLVAVAFLVVAAVFLSAEVFLVLVDLAAGFSATTFVAEDLFAVSAFLDAVDLVAVFAADLVGVVFTAEEASFFVVAFFVTAIIWSHLLPHYSSAGRCSPFSGRK